MTLRVLIVDDEPLARARLRVLLGDCREPAALPTGEADSAAQALALAQHQPFDVALVDIHMPGADGLQLAAALRDVPHPPLVVFVTAHAEHAVSAFELDAADYLTKPVRLERLQQALAKVQRLREMATRTPPAAQALGEVLLIQDRGRTERVPLTEVLLCKAELKYVTLRTASRSYVLDSTLAELEARHGAQLMRVHRNALVARHAVRALEKHFDAEEATAGRCGWRGWPSRSWSRAARWRPCERKLRTVENANLL